MHHLLVFFICTPMNFCNKAPKVQMPRCSSMYASMMQLADAYYDSTYACSRSMEASKQYHGT